eukprot:COSAG01_NODE_2947_length_6810_cov_12.567342_3_plen_339_part_00
MVALLLVVVGGARSGTNTGNAARQQQKQAEIARLEAQLSRQLEGCRSFAEILRSLCGVDPGQGTAVELQKAYKKALAKHHPDRAQRTAHGWEEVVEAEEIYKMIQNQFARWQDKQIPGTSRRRSATRPRSAGGQHGATGGPPRPASARSRPQSAGRRQRSGGGGGGGGVAAAEAAESELAALMERFEFVREEEELVRLLRMLLTRQAAAAGVGAAAAQGHGGGGAGQQWGAAEQQVLDDFCIAAAEVVRCAQEEARPPEVSEAKVPTVCWQVAVGITHAHTLPSRCSGMVDHDVADVRRSQDGQSKRKAKKTAKAAKKMRVAAERRALQLLLAWVVDA